MADTKKNTSNSQSFSDIFKDKSILSVVVATVILLLVSFFAFRYFGTSSNVNDNLDGEGISNILSTKTEEKSTDSEIKTTPDTTPTPVVSNAPTPTSTPVVTPTQTNTDKANTAVITNSEGTQWVAKDYQPNELKGKESKHTVVKGDTLWELAQAHYGNGADWHKIADANHVNYLSNGNPLIIPGQVLTIP